jgi:hypothetical protein
MKVTVRGDRLTIDLPSIGLVLAALDTAAASWLEQAATTDQGTPVRKSLLKMAGEAKAMAYLIEDKQDEPDQGPPAE